MNHLRKKLYSSTAMTLAELLTATILVGIVMAGIISVDFSIRKMRNSSGKMGNVVSRTSTVMIRLTRDAQRTIGDNSNPNNDNSSANTTGVNWSTAGTNRICFRQTDTTTPMDTTDDPWVCYTHQSGAGTNPLYRCIYQPPGIFPLPPACNPALNTTEKLLDTLARDDFFTVFPSTGIAPIQYIDFQLQHCESAATGCHTLDNPFVTEQSRVIMSGVSRY